MFEILITKQAKKDIEKLTLKNKQKVKDLILNVLIKNPYSGKKLIGDLKGYYSIRLNIKDRIVYKIDEKNKIIYIMMCKTHYQE